MIDILKEYIMTVNFSEGKFDCNDKIIMIENDNKSTKIVLNFEENDLNNSNVILKIKHYNGIVKQIPLVVMNNTAEVILTNDILIAGNLRMSISLMGTNNEILTSTEYLENIVVKESLGDGDSLTEKEISMLEKFIQDVSEFKQEKENGVFDGKSAYEIAVEKGFSGTEEEWLESFNGKSAYEIAVEIGFLGTKEEWLLNLKGEKGDKGDPGKDGSNIIGIEKTSTNGLIDTYTIKLSDESKYIIKVTNGRDGYDDTNIRNEIKKNSAKRVETVVIDSGTTIVNEYEIILPIKYIVGNNLLSLYWNGERLVKATDTKDGHYKEVGAEGQVSNKIAMHRTESDGNYTLINDVILTVVVQGVVEEEVAENGNT